MTARRERLGSAAARARRGQRGSAAAGARRGQRGSAAVGARRGQRGSAAVLVCGLIALAIVLTVAVVTIGGAVVLAGRAEAAADAAALAAADTVALGSRHLACASASLVAETNDAHLVACDLGSDAVEVVVELHGDGPIALGRTVRARSRAEIDLSATRGDGAG